MNYRRRYRGGLMYEAHDDATLFVADGPFWVDGILYDPHRAGVTAIRLMCEITPPPGPPASARCQVSRPMSEAELDEWVHLGYLS